MARLLPDSRCVAPLILAGGLALIGILPFQCRSAARIEHVRVDPDHDGAALLESLEGMGPETARRIVQARKSGFGLRSPAAMLVIPGVGTRHLHRWHPDLAFQDDHP